MHVHAPVCAIRGNLADMGTEAQMYGLYIFVNCMGFCH